MAWLAKPLSLRDRGHLVQLRSIKCQWVRLPLSWPGAPISFAIFLMRARKTGFLAGHPSAVMLAGRSLPPRNLGRHLSPIRRLRFLNNSRHCLLISRPELG